MTDENQHIIDQLTIAQAREVARMFAESESCGLGKHLIGRTVIVRTYSAGVHCGTLAQKAGREVIITNARRMWRWWAGESISLSGVAIHGIQQDKSRIAPAVPEIWLEAIEIIPISGAAAASILDAPNANAE